MEKNFTVNHLVEILRGSKNKRVLSSKWDTDPVYNKGAAYSIDDCNRWLGRYPPFTIPCDDVFASKAQNDCNSNGLRGRIFTDLLRKALAKNALSSLNKFIVIVGFNYVSISIRPITNTDRQRDFSHSNQFLLPTFFRVIRKMILDRYLREELVTIKSIH